MKSGQSRLKSRIAEAHELDGMAQSVRNFYAKWAPEYNEDLANLEYPALNQIVRILQNVPRSDAVRVNTRDRELRLVDVGCGTGFVSLELHRNGYTNIDGLDLSANMIAEARKCGVFTTLYSGIDLNMPIERKEIVRHYDCAVSVGLFTPGHVTPGALEHMASLVKPGGILILSARVEYCEATGFARVSEELERENHVKLLTVIENAPYTDDGDAHYWIFAIPAGNEVG